jgi:peroxiredoxin
MTPDRLKALFVAIYPPLVIAIAAGSIAGLALSDYRLVWAGALLTVIPFAGLYIRANVSRTLARTSRGLPLLSVVTAAGGVLAIYGFWRQGHDALLPLGAAIIGGVGFFLYDYWYSSFGRRLNDRLAPGQILPDFHAIDTEGRPVRTVDLRGRPVLYMFYRGNWCPFCMAQVREITERYRELASRGVELVLVSPQPTDLTHRVAEMFAVPCRFWVDRDLAAARELGILQEQGVPPGGLRNRFGPDTVLPTVVIVDTDGRILFADQTENYRVRPDPDIFLRVLQAHGFRARPPTDTHTAEDGHDHGPSAGAGR